MDSALAAGGIGGEAVLSAAYVAYRAEPGRGGRRRRLGAAFGGVLLTVIDRRELASWAVQ